MTSSVYIFSETWRKGLIRTGEMAHQMKHLVHQHEDLTSHPQRPVRPDLVACICNPSATMEK